jgi:hypothetical protein
LTRSEIAKLGAGHSGGHEGGAELFGALKSVQQYEQDRRHKKCDTGDLSYCDDDKDEDEDE